MTDKRTIYRINYNYAAPGPQGQISYTPAKRPAIALLSSSHASAAGFQTLMFSTRHQCHDTPTSARNPFELEGEWTAKLGPTQISVWKPYVLVPVDTQLFKDAHVQGKAPANWDEHLGDKFECLTINEDGAKQLPLSSYVQNQSVQHEDVDSLAAGDVVEYLNHRLIVLANREFLSRHRLGALVVPLLPVSTNSPSVRSVPTVRCENTDYRPVFEQVHTIEPIRDEAFSVVQKHETNKSVVRSIQRAAIDFLLCGTHAEMTGPELESYLRASQEERKERNIPLHFTSIADLQLARPPRSMFTRVLPARERALTPGSVVSVAGMDELDIRAESDLFTLLLLRENAELTLVVAARQIQFPNNQLIHAWAEDEHGELVAESSPDESSLAGEIRLPLRDIVPDETTEYLLNISLNLGFEQCYLEFTWTTPSRN